MNNVLLINLKSKGTGIKTAPHGIARLGGILLRYTRFSPVYFDEQIEPVLPIRELLEKYHPVWIGFSAQTGSADSLFSHLEEIQNAGITIPVFAGNLVATYASDEVQKRFPRVVCMSGRAEVYREFQKILKLDPDLSYPEDTVFEAKSDFEGFYRDLPMERYEEFWVECSHGCPWKADGTGCRYCAIQPGGGSRDIVIRPMEHVLADIQALLDRGVKHIKFSDEEFLATPVKQVVEVVKFLSGKGVTFDFAARVSDIIRLEIYKEKQLLGEDSDLFTMMKKAGLIGVYLGIESGSDAQLVRMHKGVTAEENLRAVRILKENGIRIAGGWIMFDPMMEDLEELRENIAFLRRAELVPKTPFDDFVTNTVNRMMVLRGAPMQSEMEERGLLGDLKENLTMYEFRWLSPWVARIVELFNEWDQKAGTAKLYRIKLIVSLVGDRMETGLSPEMEKKVCDAFFAIKNMNLEICEKLVDLAQELKQSGKNPEELQIPQEMWEKYNDILESVRECGMYE